MPAPSQTRTMPAAADSGAPLDIPRDRLAFIIEKAREYDVKEGDSDPDSGSNPIDDGQTDMLEDKADDPSGEELRGAITELNADARAQLVALAWLGRGTYDRSEWNEAVSLARSEHGKAAEAARYLVGLPLLGDYLEEGLGLFDESIVDQDDKREGLDAEDEPLGNMTDKPARQ